MAMILEHRDGDSRSQAEGPRNQSRLKEKDEERAQDQAHIGSWHERPGG